MRAKPLLIAAMIVGASAGLAPQAEATSCMDTLLNDIASCVSQRTNCLDTSSIWTRTCNIEYLGCAIGAELVYADCYYALVAG